MREKSDKDAPRYVEVALNVPKLQTLTYRVRGSIADRLRPGLRVLVPLGKRRVTGYVVSQPCATIPAGVEEASLRDVIEPLEDEPLLTEELIELTRWAADYYCCGWGEALRAALPGLKERKSVERFRLTEAGRREAALEGGDLGLPGLEGGGVSLRVRLLAALRERPRRAEAMAAAFGRGTRQELERMAEAGLVERAAAEEGGSAPPRARFVRLVHPPSAEEVEALRRRAPRQAEAISHLEKAPGGRILLRELERLSPGARAACNAMVKKGWVTGEEDILPEAPARPGEGEEAHPAKLVELTVAQQEAFDAVRADIEKEQFSVTLLHGITGSGKTEVYIRLAGVALHKGRGALILVPEIGLTPQLLGRFRARFGERVACLHSAHPERRRAAEWRRVRLGEADVVVGTRSAVFAPLPRLGFIAVDEEHDASYKQEDAPRYHARDTAVVRAQNVGAPVVLGSATPSVETYTNARRGRYRLKELPARPGGQPLPEVRIVDLRRERGRDPKTPTLLSRDLARAVEERLERGEQSLLFLNRRGFSSVLLCRDCGSPVECEHCSVALTFHREGGGRMQCHLCDHSAPPPHRCPACGSDRVGYFGLGTERVEEAVRARFPNARVGRLDRDTARRAGAYERILGAVRRGELDVLIGTQMVAKGHDFPRLTLVGVVVADVGLHLPDFRAGERTFQLLTQVAGRAGRADLPGEVVIQTFRPGHYAVECAQTHDYAAFFEREASARRSTGYPPYRRLARLRFEAKRAEAAAEAGEWTRAFLRQHGARRGGAGAEGAEIEFLGPASAPLSRVRGVWRRHILLKAGSSKRMGEALRAVMTAFDEQPKLRSVQLVVDVDPQSLL